MRRVIKRVMAKALPVYLVDQVASEIRLATRRAFTARSVPRKMSSLKAVRVNIGCGKNPVTEWINLDVIPHRGVYFWDCRSGLPFSDGAVAAIYSEHFSSILMRKRRCAHSFQNACAVCDLKASCVWSCRT